jgi:hypothetical protein
MSFVQWGVGARVLVALALAGLIWLALWGLL